MTLVGDLFLGFLRQKVNKFTSAQRLHDEHLDALLGSSLNACTAGLCVLIEIVILDKTTVPVVCVQDLLECCRVTVKREADVSDLAALLFLCDPFLNAQCLKLFPLLEISHVVHQVVIDIIDPESL